MRAINLICSVALAASALFAQPATVGISNNTSTGTTTYLLSCLDASGNAVTCGLGATGVVGVCVTSCGTSGTALIAVAGGTGCTFDAATTAGHYVIPSSSTAGDCTDAGANYPSAGSNLVGRVETSGGGGLTQMVIIPPELRPGIPVGTQYGAAYAADSSAGDLLFTGAGATGTVLVGASSAAPSFSSNVSVSGYLQVTGTPPGCLHLESSTNDSEICASASTGNWTLTLPTSAGTAGYPLVTDGSGNASWSTLGNSALANSSLTVAAGTSLSGGGSVALGGSTTLSLASALGANLDLATYNLAVGIPNQTSVGTSLNRLAKLTGSAPSAAVITTTADTSGIVGVVVAGNGTSGSAQIAQLGLASCVFDATTTAGHYVQNSTITNGDCTDAGSSYPLSGQVLGRVLSDNTGGGTYQMIVFPGGAIGSLGATSVTTNGVAYGATSSSVAFTPSVNNGVLVTSSSGVPSISTSSALAVFGANQDGSTLGSGVTTYFTLGSPAGASATEPLRRMIVPVAGTLRDFYVVTTASQPSGTGNTLVFTILKNGSATSMVVTVAAGAAAGKFSDTTDTVTLAAGDEISVQAKNNASTTSAAIADMSVLLTP